jgi:small subunit ribosomal protein S7e
LELTSTDLKTSLRDFVITAAKEVDIGSGRKAIIIYVPFKIIKSMHKGTIQPKLVRELEKKFSGRHVLFIGQRTILGKNFSRSSKQGSIRPRSRTLTSVHEAILDDIVYPTEITGKRTRCKVDGKRILKVYFDSKDQVNVEGRTDTFAAVYKKLTNKDISFQFAASA